MDLGHIDPDDRKWIYMIGSLAVVLMIGLTATGIWQFFNHESKPAFAGYVVGLGNPPSSADSTGMAAFHGLLGDVAAILTLFSGAWLSVRVIRGFPWFNASTLLILIAALITGGVIRFNATVHAGEVDVDTKGYPQFFSGEAELAITDRFELGGSWTVIWTVVHLVSIPFIVVTAGLSLYQTRRRRAEMRTASSESTWLEGLESKRYYDRRGDQ